MEIEAKWELSEPVTVATVESCDWTPYSLGERRLLRQVNEYFDTADQALRRAGFALRLRDENGSLIVTLKGPNKAEAGGVHRRDEHEAHAAAADPGNWPSDIMQRVKQVIGDQPLVSFLRITNGRQAWAISRDGHVIGELALDTGTIFAGERRGSIHELEWELKSDSEQDFEAVRAIIDAQFPGGPSALSKLQRGIALLEQH